MKRAATLALLASLAAFPASSAAKAADASPAVDAAPEAPPHAGAAEQATCLDRSVDAIQRRYEGVRDLSANFEQTVRPASLAEGFGKPTTSHGHVVLAKPGKMRWSYEAPEKSLVVSDGKTLWLYDAERGEAQRLPMTEGFLSGAAAEFLLGAGDLRRDFAITAVSCEPGAALLELVPREPASYEKVFLLADPDSGEVRRTRVVDLVGNDSTVELRDLELNRDPPAATFRFDPPKGVKVLELKP